MNTIIGNVLGAVIVAGLFLFIKFIFTKPPKRDEDN